MQQILKKWNLRRMDLVARACAVVVGLISLLMMLSWLTQWTTPLTFFPKSPPMVFNTALSLFLLSLGCIFQRNYWMSKAWMIVFLFSFLSCLQYLFEINIGIDEIFVSGYTWRYLSDPGRMPAPTAFCLLFASLGQGSIYQHQQKSLFPWSLLSVICYSVVVFLGAAGAVYYLAALSADIFWGNFAKMSLPTTFCLMLVGASGIQQSAQLLMIRHASPWKVAGVLCGMLSFFVIFVTWEIKLMENSSETSRLIQIQTQSRTELLLKEIEKLALQFQKLKIPETRHQALENNWNPQLPNAQALLRIRGQPELIWGAWTVSEKDLHLLGPQLSRDPGFRFYESLSFQRSRWMGFSQNGFLLLFSPEPLITQFFPSREFLYSLRSHDNILFSNSTHLPIVLQGWETQTHLGLWDSGLTLEVTPTRRTLSELGSSSYVPFLSAGMLFSVAVGVILSSIPRLRRRFSD